MGHRSRHGVTIFRAGRRCRLAVANWHPYPTHYAHKKCPWGAGWPWLFPASYAHTRNHAYGVIHHIIRPWPFVLPVEHPDLSGGGFSEESSCHHSDPIRYFVRGASHPVNSATVARPRRDQQEHTGYSPEDINLCNYTQLRNFVSQLTPQISGRFRDPLDLSCYANES